MRYWKCTVCGYIQEGDAPPSRCPVCGAPAIKFAELPEAEGRAAFAAYAAQLGDKLKEYQAKAAAEKEAEDLLAAAKRKAVARLQEEEPAGGGIQDRDRLRLPLSQRLASPDASAAPPTTAERPPSALPPAPSPGFIFRFLAKHHAHPVSVHVPNGIIPMIVSFLFLSTALHITNWFGVPGLNRSAFLALVFLLLAMPVVLGTGYVEWKVKYAGALTRVFLTKILCALGVTILAALLAALHLVTNGQIAIPTPPYLQWQSAYLYLLLHLLMLAFAGYAGYLGGKLVFKD
jgi:rubredoxin